MSLYFNAIVSISVNVKPRKVNTSLSACIKLPLSVDIILLFLNTEQQNGFALQKNLNILLPVINRSKVSLFVPAFLIPISISYSSAFLMIYISAFQLIK